MFTKKYDHSTSHRPQPSAFTYSHDRINFGPQHALDLSCVHVCIRAGSPHNAFACTSILLLFLYQLFSIGCKDVNRQMFFEVFNP